MELTELAEQLSAAGAEFLQPITTLAQRMQNIRGFLFDWDGVFNDGSKSSDGTGSGFSEPDAMGTNLLRFGHWLQHGELPYVIIITGENNAAARQLAEREHFTAVYSKARDKLTVFQQIQQKYRLSSEHLLFCFDDVLDLPIAARTALRFQVRRPAVPLFNNYVRQQAYFDYRTAQTGGQHAVREICELLLGLYGCYEQVLEHRCAFDATYQKYLELRNTISTEQF